MSSMWRNMCLRNPVNFSSRIALTGTSRPPIRDSVIRDMRASASHVTIAPEIKILARPARFAKLKF